MSITCILMKVIIPNRDGVNTIANIMTASEVFLYYRPDLVSIL